MEKLSFWKLSGFLALGILLINGFSVIGQSSDCDKNKELVLEEMDQALLHLYSDPSKTLSLINKSQKLIENCEADYEFSRTLYVLGNYYFMIGDLDKSIKIFSDEIWNLKDGRFPDLNAEYLLAIGRVYGKIGLQEISLEYMEESHAYWKMVGNVEREYTTIMNIAYGYFMSGDIGNAIELSYDAIYLLEKSPVTRNHSFGYTQLAEFYLKDGQYDSAIFYLEKAKPFIEIYDNNWERSRVAIMMAQINYSKGDLENAKRSALYSIKLADQNNIKIDHDSRYITLYNIYKNSDPEKALRFMEISRLYEDSLHQILAVQRIGALKTYKDKIQQQINQLQLANKLQNSKLELQKSNSMIVQTVIVSTFLFIICIILYVTIRKNLRKRKLIKFQNEQLRESNLMKNKLLALVSHDFKSPITQIISMCELLHNKSLTSDEFFEYTHLLKEHALKSSNMANTILKWSKSQLGGEHLDKSSFLLVNLVKMSISVEEIRLAEKDININLNINQDIVVEAEYSTISLAMNNLLSNAIKYSPKKGTITISSKIEDSAVHISIKDEGKGIPEEKLNKLFIDKMESTPGTIDEKGTGIGLLLTYDLIKLNGGNIWVKSELKKGTEFIFTLPISKSGLSDLYNSPKLIVV